MSDLIGKSVLIGVTCFDKDELEVDSFQVYGHIEELNEHWIGVKRDDWSELFGLPPAPELLEPAGEGSYTLRSSGEQVHDPDYVATLRVTVSDTDALLTLRGVGFVPRDT